MDAKSILPDAQRVLPGCELGGYANLVEGEPYWVPDSDIAGTLPGSLEGTLFLTCVGRNTIGQDQFGHWFDGDGAINAVTFTGGRVHFNSRFVRTTKYLKETAEQRILFRGVGTQIPGGMWRNMFRTPGNAANTNVILHGGKLLALWEGGKPWELDPGTLDTIGEYDFNGAMARTQPFSAHPRLDPDSGRLYNFGVFGVPKPKLHFYQVDAQGNMVANRSHYVGDYAMCHDFVLTEHYAVFVMCPAFMRKPFQFLFGRTSIFESIEFDPAEDTKIVVLDKSNGDIVREFTFDSFFGFHHGNGSDDGSTVTLDVLCVEDMDVMGGLSDVFMDRSGDDFDFQANGAQLKRFSLDLATGDTNIAPVAGAIAGEFPLWNPALTGKRNRYTWLGSIVENGTPYGFNAFQKIDHDTGELRLCDFGAGRFTSEANFIPAAGASNEDDGYLVCMVYNQARDKSEIVLVDAQTMTEIAVVRLQQQIPFGFHGNFYPQVFKQGD